MTTALGPAEPPEPGHTPRLLPFTNAYAPVHFDPDTGLRKVMTSTRYKAEGYEVVQVGDDAFVVDLDSQRKALPLPEGP